MLGREGGLGEEAVNLAIGAMLKEEEEATRK